MESVLRATGMYVFLLLLTRISGRRTLAEMTIFDFVLLIIIGEATQQALLGDDFSLINAFVVIGTLILADIGLSILKQKFPTVDRWLDGVPTILMRDGKLLTERLEKARIDQEDILEAARRAFGLTSLRQIRHAILERDGGISIIPVRPINDKDPS